MAGAAVAAGTFFFDPTMVGYVLVPEAIADVVLQEGYKLRKRDKVPFSLAAPSAAKTVRKYEGEDTVMVALEIRKKERDGTKVLLQEEQIHIEENGAKCYIDVDPATKTLPSECLSKGEIWLRQDHLDKNAPCHYCGDTLAGEYGVVRAQVGLKRFRNGAFITCPCPRDECKDKMEKRMERLNAHAPRILYHACTPQVAEQIRKGSCRMHRGSGGAGGGAIYFAHTARETEWKALCGADRVILECKVWMGNEKQGGRDERDTTFKSLQDEGYDSLILDRAGTNYPVPEAPVKGTRIEDLAAGESSHPGYEFLVFSYDQVEIIGIVPRDPVPAGFGV